MRHLTFTDVCGLHDLTAFARRRNAGGIAFFACHWPPQALCLMGGRVAAGFGGGSRPVARWRVSRDVVHRSLPSAGSKAASFIFSPQAKTAKTCFGAVFVVRDAALRHRGRPASGAGAQIDRADGRDALPGSGIGDHAGSDAHGEGAVLEVSPCAGARAVCHSSRPSTRSSAAMVEQPRWGSSGSRRTRSARGCRRPWCWWRRCRCGRAGRTPSVLARVAQEHPGDADGDRKQDADGGQARRYARLTRACAMCLHPESR